MPSSYTSLHYHMIFSTKERQPYITSDLQHRLYEYMGGIINQEKGILRSAGGVADHVHLLATFSPTKAVSDLLRVIKSNTSKWIHETFPDQRRFGWQDGYGAFTVSTSGLTDVEKYIAGQAEHHRQVSFKDEFVEFLHRHEIAHDERYLWD